MAFLCKTILNDCQCLHNLDSFGGDDRNGNKAVGESRSDASARQGRLRDDLLEVLGRTGVRQLPGLGKARVQAGGICFASPLGRGKRVAWEAGRRLRLRGVAHRAESARLERGYPVWRHLTNARLLDEPIPCRGNVGMWKLPEDVKRQIKEETGQ